MDKNIQNLKKNEGKTVGAGLVSAHGITLIALVFTIIILIILAGVAISLSLGENGIFSKAQQAREEYANAQAKEETEIAKATNEIDNFVDGGRTNSAGNSLFFIDTSNKIESIVSDTEYNTNSVTYTATENCIVSGMIYTKNRGTINIYYDDVHIGCIWNCNSGVVTMPIYYPVKKGSKISFMFKKDNGTGDCYKVLDAWKITY